MQAGVAKPSVTDSQAAIMPRQLTESTREDAAKVATQQAVQPLGPKLGHSLPMILTIRPGDSKRDGSNLRATNRSRPV